MPRWPPPEYRFECEFDAPRAFVFRWCTDYRPDDGRLAGERYDRRVLRRSRSEVVFEDLWWEQDGWRWRHNRVRLYPATRWHAESTANFRTASIDYRLVDLPGGRTRLVFRMRRRPTELYPEQPTAGAMRRELTQMWARYGRQLARDYRAYRRRGR